MSREGENSIFSSNLLQKATDMLLTTNTNTHVWPALLDIATTKATFFRFIPLFSHDSSEWITLGLMVNGIQEEKRESSKKWIKSDKLLSYVALILLQKATLLNMNIFTDEISS